MRAEKLLLAIGAAGAMIAARGATADACTLHGTVDTVTYWDGSSTYNPAVPYDDRCNQLRSGSQDCHLQGYYIAPVGAGTAPLPTIVFIHGSGQTGQPGDLCVSINPFVDAGYVVFVPVMRGVSGSVNGGLSFDNTGWYVSLWAGNHVTSACDTSCQTLGYMRKETRDLDSAFHWLVKAHPNRTDLSRIALMGHSYGGAITTIAAASTSFLTYTPTVAISLDGAAMSWAPNSDWQQVLNDAADNTRAPSYFQVVVNETPIQPDIGSALEPYDHVIWSGHNARLAAYSSYTPSHPGYCNDHDWHNVHCAFVWEPAGVAIWSGGVFAFLDDYGMKP